MPEKIIKKYLREAIEAIGAKYGQRLKSLPEIEVEFKGREPYGDYASNIALKCAHLFHHDSTVFASLIKKFIVERDKGRIFEKVEVVRPGFINFFLSEKYLQRRLRAILNSPENFFKSNLGKKRSLQVEFISANPTGPLTVGNARGGPFGDTLANVLSKAGFRVEKEYYINDYGNQILSLGHSILDDKKAKYRGKYIDDLRKIIKTREAQKAGIRAAKIILSGIRKTVKRMGIKYDNWFSESKLYREGRVEKALSRLEKKKLLYEKDGALWFRATQFEDRRDRVVVKKNKSKTYLAGDIAYHLYKFEEKKFSKVIDIWGADHAGDVAGLKSAMRALGHKGKLDIVLLQFVTLLEKGQKTKMSKREGKYVTMDELLDLVGKDVVRFFFLEKSPDTHLNFDLNLAQEHSEKNPVYYVQYAYARIWSILRRSKILPKSLLSSRRKRDEFSNIVGQSRFGIQNLKLLQHPSELILIKQLLRFPGIIESIARDYQVQRLPQYALDTARCFHQFYRDCHVLAENKKLRYARLSLVLVMGMLLKELLTLMGVSAPHKM